jgi:hypothetical protein
MGMSEDLEDAGMLMDWASACRHQIEGKVVVRLAWESLRPRQASIEDRMAEDWIVVPRERFRPSKAAEELSHAGQAARSATGLVRASGKGRDYGVRRGVK